MEIQTDPRTFWPQAESLHFFKTKDAHGQLSNMAGGFPLQAQGRRYQSSEGLYQALKFPGRPELQQEIARAGNAFLAKQVAYRHKAAFRPDWDEVKIPAMAYALSQKLAQHPTRMTAALRATGDKAIVELSYKDPYWGAKDGIFWNQGRGYQGANVLGQLLTRLREILKAEGNPAAAAASFAAEYDLTQLFAPAPAPPRAPGQLRRQPAGAAA